MQSLDSRRDNFENSGWRRKRAKSSSDLSNLGKYGRFLALIVDNQQRYARYFGFIQDNHVFLRHSSNFWGFFVLDFEIFA